MSVIKLYTWGTPNGNKLHIMLEELGLEYELVPVNLGAGEQRSPAFLKVNPSGKIPAIVDLDGPGGRPLTLAESGAILIYLAEKTGRLIPHDPRDRLVTLQWVMFQMGHVGPMIGQLHHFISSAPAGNGYGVERYRKEGERLLDVLEGRLNESTYLVNADYTIADICTWPWIRSWIHTTKQPLGARPALRRWYERIEQRPAVQRAIDIYNRFRTGSAAVTRGP
jgi:GSH-dependent disulfide-bond oxidoreductase